MPPAVFIPLDASGQRLPSISKPKMVDDAHQKLALGVVIAFPVLGGIAVLLRIWSRYLTRSRLGAGGRYLPFSTG